VFRLVHSKASNVSEVASPSRRAIGLPVRFHAVLLHMVLMAIVVNGLAPDAQSLASVRSVLLFCLNEDSPVRWDDEENSPDELSASAQVRKTLRIREERDNGTRSWFETTGSPLQLSGVEVAQLARIRGGVARFDGLIRLLCRLDC
jgi:hypothetical protein